MKLVYLLFFGFFLVWASALQAQSPESSTIYLSESFLAESLKENPPSVDEIQSMFTGARLQEKRFDDQFNTELSTSASYFETNEAQFATFIPVTSPVENYEVKVERSFSSGLKVGLRGFNEQFSNNFVRNASTTGLSVQLGMNLWKDLISKRTRSQLEKFSAGTESAKWQMSIGKATFLNSLRKVYWNIVANQEALKISNELLKSSTKQVAEAKKRYRNNIADKGEVARYQSQVSARKANIISLKYQRATLIKQLKELLPHISLNEIELAPYNIDETINEVLACTAVIAQESEPPMKFTHFDEIVALTDKQAKLEEKVNNSYDDIDLNIQTEYGWKGRATSGPDSIDNLSGQGRNNYAVGLTLSIPLEQKKKTTAEILQKASQLKYRAQKRRDLGKVKAYHSETIKQIGLLREIVKNQQENTQHLATSLKTSRRKYKQARLTVQQLVQEQDAYLQSNLDEINTKLAVINTILDYLSVYTLTPCTLNIAQSETTI